MKYIFQIILIAVLYFLSAKAVIPLSLVESDSVFAIWPPTGIALSALFFFGYRIWPAIFIGALALNLTITPFIPSLQIAITNTFGPVFGFYLLQHYANQNIFDSTKTMLIFFLSITLASIITALGGSIALVVHGLIPLEAIKGVWTTWFLGDLIGFLLITPIIESIMIERNSVKRILSIEGMLMLTVLIVTGLMIFGPIGLFDMLEFPVVYFLFPPLIWGVLRFGLFSAVISLLIVTIISIYGTIAGYGPFLRDDPNHSLLLLQSFNGVLAVTILLMISIFREKELLQRELKLHKEKLEITVNERTYELEKTNKELIGAYDKLETINLNLEARVKEEVLKNREKDQQLFLSAKMVAIGDMLGNIAHQWRQPLMAITMTANNIIVDIELEKIDNKGLKKDMENISKQTQYLSSTINTFRDFLKDDKESTEVILQECLEESLDIIKSSFKSNYIEIKKKIDYNNPIKLKLVNSELSQALINILNNARDAILTKKSTDKWIEISLEKLEGYALITIEDSAGGIDKSIISKIFEPYFTTKHKSQGTGLGLHISYKIVVEKLNGKLYVKNSENGAKFFIELPLDEI